MNLHSISKTRNGSCVSANHRSKSNSQFTVYQSLFVREIVQSSFNLVKTMSATSRMLSSTSEYQSWILSITRTVKLIFCEYQHESRIETFPLFGVIIIAGSEIQSSIFMSWLYTAPTRTPLISCILLYIASPISLNE